GALKVRVMSSSVSVVRSMVVVFIVATDGPPGRYACCWWMAGRLSRRTGALREGREQLLHAVVGLAGAGLHAAADDHVPHLLRVVLAVRDQCGLAVALLEGCGDSAGVVREHREDLGVHDALVGDDLQVLAIELDLGAVLLAGHVAPLAATRKSISHTTISDSRRPHQRRTCSGRLSAANTRRAGASNVRVMRMTRSEGVLTASWCLLGFC